jgi:hypothetical protein
MCVWSNTRLADHLDVPHFIILTFNGTSLILELLLLSLGLLSPDHSTSENVLYLLHFQSYAVSIKTVENNYPVYTSHRSQFVKNVSLQCYLVTMVIHIYHLYAVSYVYIYIQIFRNMETLFG